MSESSALEIADRLLHRHRADRLALKNQLQPDPDRPLRRVYCGTMVRCATHNATGAPPPECRVRSKQFCAIGSHAYWVENSSRDARDTRQECLLNHQHQKEERRRRIKEVEKGRTEKQEAAMSSGVQKKVLPTVLPLLDLTIDDAAVDDIAASAQPIANAESATASTADTTKSDTAVDTAITVAIDEDEIKEDTCLAEPDDIFADVLDKSLVGRGALLPCTTAPAELRAALERGRWVCYTLQSTVKPNRTYVGVTNDRFKRLRMHNGEITGGARMTRSDRPWRMVCLVFGFSGKIDALRFEWSMHNPRKRRLKTPYYGVSGRRHCVRQLLATSAWSSAGLHFAALPLSNGDGDDDVKDNDENDCCLAQRDSATIVARLLCDA